MIRLVNNLSIGAKLGIASALGVMLIGAMILNQLTSDAAVREKNEYARTQQTIVTDALYMKASLRAMQVAVRDIRLARSPADLTRSRDNVATQLKGLEQRAEDVLRLSRSAENRERVEKMRTLANNYARGAGDIASVIGNALQIDARRTAGESISDAAQQMAKLNDEAIRIAREVTLPIAAELEALSARIAEYAEARVHEANDAATHQAERAETISIGVGIAAALLLIASSIFSIFTIARPARALNGAMQKLAEGEFNVALPGLGRRDEIGAIAASVDRFKVKAQERAAEEAAAKAEQDRRAAAQRKKDMQALADQFEGAVGDIIQIVSAAATELEASASTLSATANDTQGLSSTVAAVSEEASANVQSVASASEQMASSITEISRQVQTAARIANDAVGQADQTNSRVMELSEAANRIGDVVDLITTIAGQTNLLALNATIEAARAGDAGRGFGVVASEVKQLADQTAKATGEISGQISSIQAATQESVLAIREIAQVIGRISEISSAIAAAVEQQGAATQEISRNVQQAASGTQDVASNIVQVQQRAGETGSASAQVLSSAQSLSVESNRLHTEVQRFLNTVRAA